MIVSSRATRSLLKIRIGCRYLGSSDAARRDRPDSFLNFLRLLRLRRTLARGVRLYYVVASRACHSYVVQTARISFIMMVFHERRKKILFPFCQYDRRCLCSVDGSEACISFPTIFRYGLGAKHKLEHKQLYSTANGLRSHL